ncbi:C1 family peptidase [uncultured Methanobrevibacter sp.]|uniref:C1 family peptidase n=1 Tax=uncultured Methanobrevibacter sp. TaxID=253161 RepID=UPI002604782A|nr:C1 family peptidase [uncultured Methanobrevibacter sp.]
MKLLKITFILLFLIISMGLASAQDCANDTVNADIFQTEDAGSFSDLKNDIDTTNATLEITKDYINDNCSNGIRIEKDNITINGNGHALDGNNKAIFYNAATNTTLNNLILMNAYYVSGSAVYNSGLLILNNVTFINNSANVGAAIMNFGSIVLNGCTFINNSANMGAAISSGGSVILNDCTFINNTAGSGGVIYNSGVMDFDGAVFINNTAQFGSAICNDGAVDLVDGVFINNSAERSGTVYNGGLLDLVDGVFINNSAQQGGAIINAGSVDLVDGVFINNSAQYGGAIYDLSNISCKNSKFMDNAALFGSAVYTINALERVSFDSCRFESKYSGKYGLVVNHNSNLLINNSLFTNSSAEYGSAIFIWSGYAITINNTHFIDLKAAQTAGAVAAYGYERITVENSRFINTTSAKNGGAVFIDKNNGQLTEGSVNIYNSSFIKSSSNFGGAYVQLSNNLTVSNSTFARCRSNYDGGAIYLSDVSAEIRNSSFVSNRNGEHDDYPTYGGAIYCDYGNLSVHGSRFINNSAFIGGGTIGIYDSLYLISDSAFDGGEAIHATFKRNGSRVVNCPGNYSICDDEVFYPQVVIGSIPELKLLTNEIDVENLPIRFDLRDFNWNASVKDQGYSTACWAFASAEALESALLKSSGLNIHFSANNMQNTMLLYSRYGSAHMGGANNLVAAGYLLSWLGPIPEENDTFDEVGKISPIFQSNLHVQDIVFLSNVNHDNVDLIKRALLNCGALRCNIYGDGIRSGIYPYYDSNTCSQYVSLDLKMDHAVAVIGWDDTFSADNFILTPPGDGAWICQNSYGEEFGDGGHFYVSYYDKTLGVDSFSIAGVLFENTVSYNKNYQYDFRGTTSFLYGADVGRHGMPITYSNRFTAVDDDLVAAVGTYFNQSGINFTIKIEVNGETLLTQEGVSPYMGYHTIKLNNYVPVKKGDEFAVYVTSNMMPISESPRLKYEANVSMTDYWGNWTDLFVEKGIVACIKAYTVGDDSRIIDNRDISVDYAGGKFFSVKVTDGDGHAVVGAVVEFTFNGRTTPVKTDSNGIAKIKITQTLGKYSIKTVYNGKTYTNKVSVKQVLTASKVTVKKTAKKFTLKATLKINGKLVKGKWITFKFAGKTYKVKTNSKGVAQKALGKNVIKKLRKGKTYTVKVTYLKDTIKTTVKVK